MTMRKNMLKSMMALAMAVLASPGAMAKWVEVTKSGSSTIYADPSFSRTSAQLVRVWHLVSLTEPEKIDGTDTQFLSFRLQNEYDCKGSRLRARNVIFYDKAMGKGKIVYKSDSTDDWSAVDTENGLGAMWKFACAKR